MATAPSTPNTLLEAVNYFSDLNRATQYVASIRWPEGFICPDCGGTEYSYLSKRRLWQQCKACRKQTSVKAGTVFQDSPVPLTKWVPALWLLVTCKNGVSSYEIARGIGVSQKCAWFMLQRLRLALQEGSIEKYADKFDGVVEVDETYIGGKARNMHASKRRRLESEGRLKGHSGKTAVMGFYERGGKVRLTVIDGTTKPYLQQQVRRHVRPEAHVMTDALASYQGLDAHYVHKVIDHAEKYAEGLVHTNGLENFWSLLKRGLSGTYVCVRPFHMFRYLDEQAFRYNYRKDSDTDRFAMALGRAPGRRVTWAELTSKPPQFTGPEQLPLFAAGRRRVFPQRPFRNLYE